MGNSQSSPDEHASHPVRPSTGSGSKHVVSPQQQRKNSPLPAAPRAPAVVPIASSASTSTSNTHVHAQVSHSPASTHSRTRSITTSTPKTQAIPDAASSHKSEASAMGNNESRPQPPPTLTAAPSLDKDKPVPSPVSLPVNVPGQSYHVDVDDRGASPVSSSLSHGGYGLPPSDYSRPPRLPLPIEEEVHSPGSPIITPQDLSTALDLNGVEGVIPRRTSVLSSTTVDDEDVGDNEAMMEANSLAPTVPTRIEWTGPGDKIYVTGTFVNWERKFKLHRSQDKGSFSATLQLKPGTHHIKFLVDGDMITSDDLPTTVDYTNILVNYIEVVAPMPLAGAQPAPGEPMPIPGTAQTAGQTPDATELPPGGPVDKKPTPNAAVTESDLVATIPQSGQVNAPSSAVAGPVVASASQLTQTAQTTTKQGPAVPRQKRPRPKYTNHLPDFLHDLDVYTNPEDERCQRANRAVSHLPQPPSLPMFMSKSILNGTTPHKDDASVLIMPNHTVLNHLATSSIKSGVLATSGTTRYKRKFLTTIMYKPTSDDG